VKRRLTRAALAVALACSAAGLSGCGDAPSESIQVAVVWTGYELERFHEVVDDFEAENPQVSVDVVSAGDDMDAFLRARDRAGGLPDVALLGQPGLVDQYVERGWLDILDDQLGERYEPFWRRLGVVDRELYGVVVKASFKSLLWYRTGAVDESGLATWESLRGLVQAPDGRRTGGRAPLAIGAADTWVLTDWFENALLARDDTPPPRLYGDLTQGEALWCEAPVREALLDLGRLWRAEDAFPGGPERVLLTGFDESVVQVAAADEAALLVGNDFVQAITSGALADTEAGTNLAWVRMPSPTGRQPALLGGDIAVVMRDGAGAGSDAAHHFVDWLARSGSFESWITQGGYYSALLREDAPYPDQDLAELVRTPPRGAAFDLSDLVERPMRAHLEAVLQQFFVEVAGQAPTDGRISALATRAASALNEAVGGRGCEGEP
jgi:ABC-type glycerol-3-phosphate transport system substrate-binding protein